MAAFSNAAFGENTAFDSTAFDLGAPATVNESFSAAVFGKDTALSSSAWSFGEGAVIVVPPPTSGGGGITGRGYGDDEIRFEYTLAELRDEEDLLTILMLASMYHRKQ